MSDFLISFDFPAPGPLTTDEREVGLNQRNKVINQDELTSIRNTALLKTFYTREDLLALLAQSDSNGIRIYPVIVNGNISTLAVATDSERNDMVKGAGPCFISNGFEPASRLTKEQGEEAVVRYNEHLVGTPGDLGFALRESRSRKPSIVNYSKVFFTSQDITNLMDSDSKGIHFYTTKIRFNDRSRSVPTLTAVEVNSNGEESSTALMSALPCPPNCGGGYIGEATVAEQA